ncbi:50S ribosomal protein L3 [Candidatus Saccharibacteria bacterium]|nr:50S ribosomal protein L3 [Candidatus Saccharibacteria bacterium]
MKALLATKIGMTQIYDANGRLLPVTVLQAGPCVVTQIKTVEHDGYKATQIGFGDAKKLGKSIAGHLKASGANSKHLVEIRTTEVEKNESEEAMKVGDTLTVEMFEAGEKVSVSATSKGKGFAGTIKRHNFHRGPKTHGSQNYRAPGSIGAGYPQHVMKGIKMAGRMGHDKVTVKNLKVATIDAAQNLIAVTGAVPGPNKGLVVIKGLTV